MKNAFMIAFCAFAFIACNKDKKQATCYWTVNGQSFQSNDTKKDEGKARTDFEVNGSQNSLGFTFWFQGLPESGSMFLTNNPTQNPAYAGVGLYFNSVFYIVKYDLQDRVIASRPRKNQNRLHFDNVWFKNYYQPEDDSVLVSCDFYAGPE